MKYGTLYSSVHDDKLILFFVKFVKITSGELTKTLNKTDLFLFFRLVTFI